MMLVDGQQRQKYILLTTVPLPLALPQLTKGSPTLSCTVVSGPERPGKRFLPEGMKRTNLGSRQKVIGSGSRDCQGKQPSEIIPSQAKELRRLLFITGKRMTLQAIAYVLESPVALSQAFGAIMQ